MQTAIAPQNLDALAALAWTSAIDFLPRLTTAAIILAVGLFAARAASRLVGSLLARTGHIDETVRPVLAAVVRYAIVILVVVAALGQVGVQTASLLAVLGAAGLAIGLALQGTLTNIAAGIMLLWLRPFRVGDYIEVQTGNGVAGIVRETGLFACRLETFDGIVVFAPNSTIWNYALRNHSRGAGRLVSLGVSLAAGADLDLARRAVERLVAADARVLRDPPPDVFVETFAASGARLTCRLWARPHDIGAVQRGLIEEIGRCLETADSDLRPAEIVRTVPGDADPSRFIGSDRRERQRVPA